MCVPASKWDEEECEAPEENPRSCDEEGIASESSGQWQRRCCALLVEDRIGTYKGVGLLRIKSDLVRSGIQNVATRCGDLLKCVGADREIGDRHDPCTRIGIGLTGAAGRIGGDAVRELEDRAGLAVSSSGSTKCPFRPRQERATSGCVRGFRALFESERRANGLIRQCRRDVRAGNCDGKGGPRRGCSRLVLQFLR